MRVGLIACVGACVATIGACGEAAESSPESLSLHSPALVQKAGIIESFRARYRCKENSIWMPLRWSRVPENTAELVVTITVSKVRYRRGPAGPALESEFVGASAIGGLDPSQRGLSVGDLPPKAFIVDGSDGTVCPPPSQRSTVQFAVHALPPGRSLRESDVIDVETIEGLDRSSLATGLVLAFYGRRN